MKLMSWEEANALLTATVEMLSLSMFAISEAPAGDIMLCHGSERFP